MRNKTTDKSKAVRRAAGQRGIALIAVLWVTVLLSLLATALIAMSRSDTRRLASEIARVQAGEAANSGIILAATALETRTGERWPVDGASRTLRFGDAELSISVWAESGKIDLNTGDRALIRGLLVVEGAGPGAADVIANTIVEKRDPKNSNSTDGARLFESPGELLRIPGITQQIFDRLAPNITVYSGSSGVDRESASRDVLLSIPGNTAADADAVLKARSSPTTGILSPTANDRSRVGQAFQITVTARMPDGAIGRRTKIVRLTGSLTDPLWILAIE